MNNDLPIVGVLPGGKDQIRNVGVARITGAQLTAAGYKVNWLYLITDIGCVATYENQGRDCWLGTDGIPVAGTSTIFAALPPPLEGQRFYNITTQQPLQYKGGAWGGATWAANQILTPSTIIVTAAAQLAPQRDHLVVSSDVTHTLPSSAVAKNGHIITVLVAAGAVNNLLLPGAGTTLTSLDVPNIAVFELLQAQTYQFVYYNNVWTSFTESAALYLRRSANLGDLGDIDSARANLDVLSAAQVLNQIQNIQAGRGLSAQGIAGNTANPFTINADFATIGEFLAGVEDSKAVAPNVLRASLDQLIETATAQSKFNTVTGLVAGSESFTITQDNSTTISWTAARLAINPDPDLRAEDVVFIDLEVGQAAVPQLAGYVLQFIEVGVDGVVAFTANLTVRPMYCRLGVALVKDGNIVWLLQTPQVATADYYLRGAGYTIVNGGVQATSTPTSGNLQSVAATLLGESVNWAVKTPDLHKLTQPAQAPLTWSYWRTASIEVSQNTVVDGRVFADGSVVPANAFTIQSVLRDWAGQYYVIAGATQYATMTEAVNAVGSAIPTIPTFLQGCSVEVTRMILRGDQFAGSANLNLANNERARFFDATLLRGAGGAGSGAASQEIRIVTAAGELQYGNRYIIQTTAPINFPPISSDGLWLSVRTEVGTVPVITEKNNQQLINDTVRNVDSASFTLDVPGQWFDFYIRAGKWRW